MTEQKIPERFTPEDPELVEKIAARMESWQALRNQDGTPEGTMHSIAEAYEMMKREYEIQRAVVGHLVSRLEDKSRELHEEKRKND